MKITIYGEWNQIGQLIPIIQDMLDDNYLSLDEKFIAPFQYGDSTKDNAIIKCTKSGNFIIDMKGGE